MLMGIYNRQSKVKLMSENVSFWISEKEAQCIHCSHCIYTEQLWGYVTEKFFISAAREILNIFIQKKKD
jgi:hypothetical protein